MVAATHPYSVPSEISATLRRVLAYWESLKRGDNMMPFWDDVNLTVLPDLNDRLLLVDVFDMPERFRFNFIGKEFARGHIDSLANKSPMRPTLRRPSPTSDPKPAPQSKLVNPHTIVVKHLRLRPHIHDC